MIWRIAATLATVFNVAVDDPNPKNDCGVNCLFVAFYALDENCEVRLDNLTEQLSPRSRGNSLEELANVARKSGFHASPVKTSLDALRIRKRPFLFIAHVNTDHFVLISDVTATTVTVEDSPRSAQAPSSSFLSNWDSTGLLISIQELESEESLAKRLWWSLMLSKLKTSGAVLFAGGLVFVASRFGWRRWRASR